MELKAYEGPEKYIFVSYAHKDSDDVLKILSRLTERGYRIWYDEGIAPGSEWPENIARHLDASATVLAFISPRSVASPNCRREITFALSRQKPFLSVVLSQTEMPLGMELQLSAQQSVLRYNFKTEEAFLDKICACPDLKPCRKELSTEGLETVESASLPEEVKPEAHTLALPKPVKKPVKKQTAVKQAKSGKKKKALAIAAACIALVVILAAVISLANTVTIVDGYKLKKSDTYASVRDATISSSVIQNINKLKRLTSLSFINCTFDPGALDELRIAPSSFILTDCSGVDSLDILMSIENLGSLTIQNSNLRNLPDLTGTKLYRADLMNNPDFTDISVLPSDTLTYLNVSNTGVSDLSYLAGCSKLSSVIADNSQVADISCLSNLQKLTAISMNNCRITTADTESFALQLKTLNLANNNLKDCSGFRNTTVLKEVNLSGNDLTDVSWLRKSGATLTELDLSGNNLDAEQIAFVGECVGLRKLYLNDIPMEDLSLLEKLSNLNTLEAIHCGIRNIDALEMLPQLEAIRLSLNEITDISALCSIPFGSYSTRLDLAYNKISSVSVLDDRFIGGIALQGNPVVFTDSTLSGTEGWLLSIDYSEGLERSGLTGHKITQILITGCPADRQLAVQTAVGYNGKIVSKEERLEAMSTYFDYSPWEAYLP